MISAADPYLQLLVYINYRVLHPVARNINCKIISYLIKTLSIVAKQKVLLFYSCIHYFKHYTTILSNSTILIMMRLINSFHYPLASSFLVPNILLHTVFQTSFLVRDVQGAAS
jgi:hypothetical protein